jgi:hypothetical protein
LAQTKFLAQEALAKLKKARQWVRNIESGNYLYRGKGMVLHVQSSTNYGLGCFKNKRKYSLCTNSHFFSGLTTAQAVDPLPLYRDFPD